MEVSAVKVTSTHYHQEPKCGCTDEENQWINLCSHHSYLRGVGRLHTHSWCARLSQREVSSKQPLSCMANWISWTSKLPKRSLG
eukprot:3910049-Amphidinium_carterae.2